MPGLYLTPYGDAIRATNGYSGSNTLRSLADLGVVIRAHQAGQVREVLRGPGVALWTAGERRASSALPPDSLMEDADTKQKGHTMRYYEVHLPWQDEPMLATNVRALRDLPEGTRVYRVITERDGSLSDMEEIPVENGRALIAGRGKQRPKMTR